MDDATLFLNNALKVVEDGPKLEAKSRQAAEAAETANRVADAVRRLRRSWRDSDPGKYGSHWFLVREFQLAEDPNSGFTGTHRLVWCDRFWPRELIEDAAAAERGIETDGYGRKLDRPIPVALGSFAEAKKEICLGCKTDGLLVGCYEQTYDSCEGDEWEIRLYAMCTACPTLRLVARRADEYRMSHLLRNPAAY